MYEYIYSLTTIPSRVKNIDIVIDSLVNQNLKSAKIILNIPRQFGLRFNKETIPIDIINRLKNKYASNNLIINIIKSDYGPGTKLLGLFDNNIIDLNKPNTFIVLVDDDLIYKPVMLEYFNDYIKKRDVQAASFCTGKVNEIAFGQGADGFFIKSNILTNFYSYYNLIKNNKYILYHDDLYISYYLYLKNIPIINLRGKTNLNPNYEAIWIYDKHGINSNNEALYSLKGDLKRGNLNIEIYNYMKRLKSTKIFHNI